MKGKVVVVTGAFGALGSVCAAAARARGAEVAAIDFSSRPLGGDAFALGGVDLADSAAAQAAAQQVLARFGRVDALLNTVGGFVWQTTLDGDPAAWERMHRLNVLTVLNAVRAFAPALRASGGSIVNVGANGAVKAAAGMGAYAASKAGVHRLTEALAEELKGEVRVNAVLPLIIDTPQNRADMPDADPSQWVTPQQLAEVMLFLASDEASAMTGALVPVTGRL